METIFINTKNSKTSEPHRFILYFTDKLDLRENITVALANISIYYTWKNIKNSFINNKFKISAPTWNKTFDLPDGCYTIEDFQSMFLQIVQKHEPIIKNNEESSVLVYPNKRGNRIIFK